MNQLDYMLDELIDDIDKKDYTEETEDFEEATASLSVSIAIPDVALMIGAGAILGVCGLIVVGNTAPLIKGGLVRKKLDAYYSSKDSKFIPFSDMKMKTFRFNALQMDGTDDFEKIIGKKGKEVKGVSKLANLIMNRDMMFVWYYGSTPMCVACIQSAGRISTFSYAISKNLEKYVDYYIGNMAYHFSSVRGGQLLSELYDKYVKQNDTFESAEDDFPLGNDYFEDMDEYFSESAESKDIKKFNKLIRPAVNATYSVCRFAYGVEMDGRIYNIDRSEYPKYYHYLDRETFTRVRGGLAYDYCRFLYPFLQKGDYETVLYFIEIEGTLVNHMFPMIRVPLDTGDRYLYCEAAKKNMAGCYWTKDLNGMLDAIISALRAETIISKPTKVVIRKSTLPKDSGISYSELLKYLRSGEIYDSWMLKPRAGTNSSARSAGLKKFDPTLITAGRDIQYIK